MVNAEPVVQTVNLWYTYSDGTPSLRNVNFSAVRNTVTALIGSNGAGKSSFLLTLNGILRPQSGQVLFRGRQISYSRKELGELRRQVGIVFQNPDSQIFSASVYQDISFGLCNAGLPETVIRPKIDAIMAKTGIEALREKPVHALSFGQKKRVALAGVLVMEPDLLLLDEPTAGLDPAGAVSIMRLVKTMQRSGSMSVVIATHDIEMVPLYCDRICVMHAGEILFEGSVAEVFARKQELRQAGLRLPRIGHLMEILQDKDGFLFREPSFSIGTARKRLNEWRDSLIGKN